MDFLTVRRGVRGCLGAILLVILRQRAFRTFFESILGSSWTLQGGGRKSLSWSKNEPKSKTKKTMQQEGLQDRLGEVLEPIYITGLGVILRKAS